MFDISQIELTLQFDAAPTLLFVISKTPLSWMLYQTRPFRFPQIHQACKPICRKCKRHVTELTGQVVQEGTRRYRLCNECLAEAGIDSIRIDLEAEAPLEFPQDGDKDSRWHYGEDNRSDVEIVEDGSSDLVIQQVDDSEDEAEEKEVKPNIR